MGSVLWTLNSSNIIRKGIFQSIQTSVTTSKVKLNLSWTGQPGLKFFSCYIKMVWVYNFLCYTKYPYDKQKIFLTIQLPFLFLSLLTFTNHSFTWSQTSAFSHFAITGAYAFTQTWRLSYTGVAEISLFCTATLSSCILKLLALSSSLHLLCYGAFIAPICKTNHQKTEKVFLIALRFNLACQLVTTPLSTNASLV